MGCCLSTNHPPKPNPDLLPSNHHYHFSKSSTNGGSFPHPLPSPPPEEETVVKEVLSETPIPKQPTSILIQPNKNKEPEIEEQVKIEPTAVIKPIEEIVSEVSEMYSFSESYSTTTVTEMRDDDGEVTQILKPPARVPRKRPERGPRSPARRPAPAPSPEKRSHISSRSVQSRTMTTQRRNVGPPNRIRRETAEGSGGRSRSPVTCGEAAAPRAARHESPIATNAGRFCDRAPAGTSEYNGKLGSGKDDVSPGTGECESLENPLVSFECFIFL